MSNQYFDSTVPVFVQSLTALKIVLQRGEAFAKEKKVTDEVLLRSRIAVDMFDLVRQVQVACDNAKGSAARLAGVDVPKMEDNEHTFTELESRIDKTITFLSTLTVAQFEEAGERHVTLPYFKDKHFIGREYIYEYALPNFFFHIVTAYDILRHLGVPLGKNDYLGSYRIHDGA